MAVKYRIEYCNKESDTARLDIDVRGYSGQVYPIEGTGDLFILEYKRSDDYFLTTVADIQLFSDTNFNIDVLKTSDETELKALFYVNNVLKWQGYILPDFFQTGIRGTEAISMTATDRLSVLKDIPLDYSREKKSYIQLITECLAKTGLSLNCNVVADFMLDGMPSTFHIMNCYVEHARITNRNKSLSAYDVLRSVLVMLNAQIVQYGGEWWIVNRYQLRNGGGRVYNYTTSGIFNTSGTFTPVSIPFGIVEANGRRSIEPVASQTSVFMEFGGVIRYPEDYEFKNYNSGYAGWTGGNGFSYGVSSKELLGYTAEYLAVEGTRDVRPRMWQSNGGISYDPFFKRFYLTGKPYLKSTPLVNRIEGAINIDVQISATGMNGAVLPVIILIDNKHTDAKKRYYCCGINGIEKLPETTLANYVNETSVHGINFSDKNLPTTAAISASKTINYTINPTDVGVTEMAGTEFTIIIYGTNIKVYIEEASIGISNASNGKGVLYRTEQGAGGYSNKSDTDTTIFGDHLSQGINGFFYAYSPDELSIHSYLGQSIRTGWTSPNDALVDPLLLHSVRQRARMNSKAKNILNVEFSTTFNPLAIYTCNAASYVVRSARHDFLRTRTAVELEENVWQNLVKKDYVYTYFGDEKEKGISSLSGISVGGGGVGGASHSHLNKDIIDQLSQVNLDVLALLEIDENDNLKVNANLYSTGELSAYGIGSSSGGGGTGSTVAWGTEASGAVPLTVEGITKTLSLASHTHSGYLTAETDPTVPAHVKAITPSNITVWNSYGSQVHSHLNKALLDTYTQTEADLADAVSRKHTHSNLSILNATTASFLTADKTKLNGIAAGAQVNVQANWDAVSGQAAILNKPSSLPASDVHPWAKESTKPSYVASEIGGLGASYRWLTDAYIATWNSKANGTHTHNLSEIGITGLTANYLTKFNGSTLVNSQIYDNGTNVGIGEQNPSYLFNVVGYTTYPVARFGQGSSWNGTNYAIYVDGYSYLSGFRINGDDPQRGLYAKSNRQLGFATDAAAITFSTQSSSERMRITADGNVGIGTTTPTATLDVKGTGKFKDDILMTFNTWSHATDKNSLNKFLKLFDIDTAGNLVVKTNLYSAGEVSAYSSGTGVSGLTLMGNMNANGKNITGAQKIYAGNAYLGNVGINPSLQWSYDGEENTIAEYSLLTGEYFYAANQVKYGSGILAVTGIVDASEFKFGLWTFKEVGGNMVISYNGTAKATIQSSRTNSNL